MVRKLFVMTAATAIVMALVGYAVQAQGAAGSTQPGQKSQGSVLVNLNSANASELQGLPGVGPAMATRIIEYRQKNGGFKKIEDLMNVKGIGEKKFLKLKPLVTVAAAKPSGQ